jgi:chromosome partitioning protein
MSEPTGGVVVPEPTNEPAPPSGEPVEPDVAGDSTGIAEEVVPEAPATGDPSRPQRDPFAVGTTEPTSAAHDTDARWGAGELADPVPTGEAAHRTRVIALANQKGGVGKTTTTVNMGAALAELDHRVLIVDLDPQGNATTGLGINYRVLEHTMYDVLLQGVHIDDCIEPTEVRGLFVAPASLDLAGAEIELVPAFSREAKLKRALEDVVDDYDFVLIDCPPSLGLLTVNGLVAATEVMVPIQCEYYALEGLAQLTRNVELVRENLNPTLEITGIVLVMYDSRTKLGEQVVQEVREHFGEKVCRNMIPRNVKLSEAPSFGQPITVYDSSSRGAVAYRELAREVSRGS